MPFLLLALLAVLLPAGAARAQSEAALLRDGVALREQGRDEEALALFEDAYQAGGSGEALAQIALAEQALDRLVEAEAHLQSALASTEDRFVRRHHAALEEALEALRAALGDLEIEGGSPGAEVWIGDISRGLLPLRGPVRVPLGRVTVVLRVRGEVVGESSVEVTAGELARLVLATPEPEPEPEPEPSTPAPEPPPSPPSTTFLTPLGVAVGALGVVALGVATGFMVLREDSARARLRCSDTDPACRAQFQTALDAETASVALYLTGGVLLATGAVLLVLDVLRTAHDETALVCAPGALSLACVGRF